VNGHETVLAIRLCNQQSSLINNYLFLIIKISQIISFIK
jgi:hypothetical protein